MAVAPRYGYGRRSTLWLWPSLHAMAVAPCYGCSSTLWLSPSLHAMAVAVAPRYGHRSTLWPSLHAMAAAPHYGCSSTLWPSLHAMAVASQRPNYSLASNHWPGGNACCSLSIALSRSLHSASSLAFGTFGKNTFSLGKKSFLLSWEGCGVILGHCSDVQECAQKNTRNKNRCRATSGL